METQTESGFDPEALDLELTDVESLPATEGGSRSGDSSITQLPLSHAETEINLDQCEEKALITEFLEAQFPGEKMVKIGKWLECSEEGEKLGGDQQGLSSEEIEKTAAQLGDAIKNHVFDANKIVDTEQEVPRGGDFKRNMLKEIVAHPALTLMNIIKSLINQKPNGSKNVYTEVLSYLCNSSSGNDEEKSVKLNDIDVDWNSLESFNGGYYDKVRLTVKTSKAKMPLVRAVNNYVTEQIKRAAEIKSPVLFTQYAVIPEIVKQCNDLNGLNFIPDKLAGYAIILQRAVHQEMVARCLDFLSHVGFKMSTEDPLDNVTNQTIDSAGMCSQGSQTDDSYNSANSQELSNIPASPESLPEVPPEVNDFFDRANMSPGFIEHVRAQMEDSPPGSTGSQGSWTYDSQTPPQYSIPEQESSQPANILNNEESIELAELDSWQVIDVTETELLFRNQEPGGSLDSSASSYESGEPRRQRRRIEY